MRTRLTETSLKRPWTVIIVTLIITLAFATQFPRMKTDTDPNNMLPETADVRVSNREVEQIFGLHKDMMAVGIVNNSGIFNPQTVNRMARLTEEIRGIDGVAAQDVTSFLVAANMAVPPNGFSGDEVAAMKDMVMGNPLMAGRFISENGTTSAIYVPLNDGANGKEVADAIRQAVDSQPAEDTFYVAGDPVARDTFGSEMFLQMGLFSPLAGLIMMLMLYLMFRNWPLTFSIMGVAMISIVWTLGALIGLGYPVHIMSSMIPVFLMAISTSSIHIFNEFYFCCGELNERRKAITKTMSVMGAPVAYTALVAAIGFSVLGIGDIIPVRVFGLFVAFGIAVITLLTFTFLPAVMVLMGEKTLHRAARRESPEGNRVTNLLGMVGRFTLKKRYAVLLIGLVLVGLSIWGITKIRVNNNMVAWFKGGSDIRVADRVINDNLGGSSLAYMVAEGNGAGSLDSPAALKYIEGLQAQLMTLAVVGNTYSVADSVKMASMMMAGNDPSAFSLPESQEQVSQILMSAARPSDLDQNREKANIQVQLKTWDASAMDDVLEKTDAYISDNPPPSGITFRPAGIAYFNKVWNDEVLGDMIRVFIIGTAIILLVLIVVFRSLKWALVSFIPLLFTILLIFGAIGFLGKDFDMPIAVLSTLSLGLAVDFAIHFVRRYRQRLESDPDIEQALLWTIVRPGKGIIRNAILFSATFSVMIFAALTPYITVGFFIMSIVMVSAVLTLVYLPAVIRTFGLR
ncbi:MAG: MMPL family transporter [Actinobacteria bacterium]|nr:MMPL family transporter [Actinomycetota bacterium]